jgi:hypothetical protein
MFILINLQSCDEGWDFDVPGCTDEGATNYDPNATFDNESCYFSCSSTNNSENCLSIGCFWWENECHDITEPLEIFTIDASSYHDWVYFSFDLGSIVNVSEPDNSIEWDVAFKRNNIITNGGLSGVGNVCAIVDDSQTWTSESFESIQGIPNNECQVDEVIEGNDFTYQGCYNPDEGHVFEDCVKNPSLDKWGWFDNTYYFNITNFQLFMRITNGIYIKFWPMSYYNTNQESGQISFVYQIISDD